MKCPKAVFSPAFALAITILLFTQTNGSSAPTTITPRNFSIIARGANHQIWERTDYETNSGKIFLKRHHYIELATGMNFWNGNQWVESRQEIIPLPDGGAAATNGQHQVYFPGDIYSGAIELVTPDGKHLYGQPLGLSYFDGNGSVLIAELKHSTGILIASNQVIYPDAFTDFRADLRYTYTKAGFEQDIILQEQPPAPASFGLNPDITRLQILTEFYNPPQPSIIINARATGIGLLTDQNLDFGAMKMVPGKAFLIGGSSISVPVNKHWTMLDGRQFLIEEVPTASIGSQLETLPLPAAQAKANTTSRMVAKTLTLPPRISKISTKTKLITKAYSPAHGLVLDYQVVNGSFSDFTFQGDTTYDISGAVAITGTSVFEAGTVLKYEQGGELDISGPVNFETGPYRMAVLTGKDDDSVGEQISGSTGHPQNNYYANVALNFNTPSLVVTGQYIRVACALTGAVFSTASGSVLKHSQFVNVGTPISANSTTLSLQNDLMYIVTNSALDGSSSTIQAENLTIHRANYINSSACTVNLTNSLLVSITNSSGYSGAFNATSANDAVFKAVGNGAHYLADDTYRNVGTLNVSLTLSNDLKQLTTYAPLLISSNGFTNVNMNILSPIVGKDTDIPDLGYHYAPLDYVLTNSFFAYPTTITLTNGAGIGLLGTSELNPSLNLFNLGSFYSLGSVTRMNNIANSGNVQEMLGGVLCQHIFSSDPGSMIMKFTDFSLGQGQLCSIFPSSPGSGYHVYSEISIQDCRLRGVELDYSTFDEGSSDVPGPINLTNNVFERCSLNFSFSHTVNDLLYPVTFALNFDNNLLWNSPFNLSYNLYDSGCVGCDGVYSVWGIFNNLFHGQSPTLSIGGDDPVAAGYLSFNNNGFVSGANDSAMTGANDVSVSAADYQTGPLGNYYYPTNGANLAMLVNAGSTNANLLSLYHYTTQINLLKETNSIVDIGFHYVATDANGIPIDTNGDGIPDYIEDVNGNGLVDSGEIGWNIFGDAGLKVQIAQPRNGGIIP